MAAHRTAEWNASRASASLRAGAAASILLGCALLLMAAAACSPTCRDQDKDGRGEGCERGPDCDDADPKRALRCVEIPARCRDNPTLEGCPCSAAEDDACYTAAPETVGVGLCRAGRALCSKGVFVECRDSVSPTAEQCNERDDDCDGKTDERVASPCGGCDDRCIGGVWGPPVEPFEIEEGFARTPAGELTLARVRRERSFVWVPNTDEGTVSKIDAERALELARYRTPGARPVRVAVDHRGDAWVLDSPREGKARLAKLSHEPERCLDRDGDGLETSQGREDVLERDECWTLDVEIGEPGDDAQALAIDGAQAPDAELAGNAWVGLAAGERLLVIDGNTGEQLASVALPDFAAYAASFDAWGRLWLLDRKGALARVGPRMNPPEVELERIELPCYVLESVYTERDGRLLFAGFGCESVARFDPWSGRWQDLLVPGLLSPRAIAEAAEVPWVVYTSGAVARIEREPFGVSQAFELAAEGVTPFESIALAADSRERLWIVSTQGGPNGRGVATRFDPQSGAVTGQVVVGLGPRGGGDLTGSALGDEFVREAEIRHVFEGECNSGGGTGANGTLWKALHLTAEVGAGGSVEVAVRWAEDRDALDAAAFSTAGVYPDDGASFPLSFPEGGAVEVQLTLRSLHAIGAPRIARVGLAWTCAGPQ